MKLKSKLTHVLSTVVSFFCIILWIEGAAAADNFETSHHQTSVQRICNPDSVVESVDVHSNPDGYYIPELQIQMSFGDKRIVNDVGSNFLLCTSGAITPDTGDHKSNKQTMHLFVPISGCKTKAQRT